MLSQHYLYKVVYRGGCYSQLIALIVAFSYSFLGCIFTDSPEFLSDIQIDLSFDLQSNGMKADPFIVHNEDTYLVDEYISYKTEGNNDQPKNNGANDDPGEGSSKSNPEKGSNGSDPGEGSSGSNSGEGSSGSNSGEGSSGSNSGEENSGSDTETYFDSEGGTVNMSYDYEYDTDDIPASKRRKTK